MNNDYSDNKTISLLHFRLRTARHKKRAQHEDRDRQLLALRWEQDELWTQKQNLGWIELNPPVTRGYKRYFVLHDDVARGKYANFFAGILQKINTIDYSYRKDFKVKKRKRGKKIYVVKEQHLLQPQDYHFIKLKFTDAEKQQFEERIMLNEWTRKPYKVYVFVEPWRFVLRVRPNLITKTRARDEVIESRIRQIRNYLERNDLQGRLDNLLGNSHHYNWYRGERQKEKNPLRNKSIEMILGECGFYNEEILI